MLPIVIASPNKNIIKPRYIGFLVCLYKPSFTISRGFDPGIKGVPNLWNVFLPFNVIHSPIIIAVSPNKLYGKINIIFIG